jgi:hypothetical protein
MWEVAQVDMKGVCRDDHKFLSYRQGESLLIYIRIAQSGEQSLCDIPNLTLKILAGLDSDNHSESRSITNHQIWFVMTVRACLESFAISIY